MAWHQVACNMMSELIHVVELNRNAGSALVQVGRTDAVDERI